MTGALGLVAGVGTRVLTARPTETATISGENEPRSSSNDAPSTTGASASTSSVTVTGKGTTTSLAPALDSTTQTAAPPVVASCDPVAVGRVGESMTVVVRKRSVAFRAEICETTDGSLWYHGVKLAGDPEADSITLPAASDGNGAFTALNAGWRYTLSSTRLVLVAPNGAIELDHPVVDELSLIAAQQRSGTLLVDVANLRTEPNLSAVEVARLADQQGATVAIFGVGVNGWLDAQIGGSRGWIFGAFVSPPDAGLTIARTKSEMVALLLDSAGRSLGVENASGSYVLVFDDASNLWQVILPDGATAYVDGSTMNRL